MEHELRQSLRRYYLTEIAYLISISKIKPNFSLGYSFDGHDDQQALFTKLAEKVGFSVVGICMPVKSSSSSPTPPPRSMSRESSNPSPHSQYRWLSPGVSHRRLPTSHDANISQALQGRGHFQTSVMARLFARLDALSAQLDILSADLRGVKQDVGQASEEVGQVRAAVVEVRKEVEEVRQNVSRVQQKQVGAGSNLSIFAGPNEKNSLGSESSDIDSEEFPSVVKPRWHKSPEDSSRSESPVDPPLPPRVSC